MPSSLGTMIHEYFIASNAGPGYYHTDWHPVACGSAETANIREDLCNQLFRTYPMHRQTQFPRRRNAISTWHLICFDIHQMKTRDRDHGKMHKNASKT